VETVHKFDGLAGGRLVLGMTADDIYIFREGRKVRFMPDRRVLYTDLCVAPEQGWFACSFSDSVFNTHGLAFGDANARLGWTRDLQTPPNRVAITGDGRCVVVGMQDGLLMAMDNMRTPLWECVQGEPITALALPAAGARPVAGTESGTVVALDEDGGFRWRSPVGLPVIAVATDTEARWVAAVVSNEAAHLLVCFGPDGSPLWEYELEGKPTGVSLSPNGRYLLVSGAGGAVSCFEVDFQSAAARLAFQRSGGLDTARAAAAAGDLAHAHGLFAAHLEAAPHDVSAAAEMLQIGNDLVTRLREEADLLASEGRMLDALQALERAAQFQPWDPELFNARADCRRAALEGCRQNAEALEANRDWDAARSAWLEALRLDPACVAAREALARIRSEQATELMLAGDQLEAFGDRDEAVALWHQAEALDATDQLRSRLQRAEVARCVAAGIAFYEAQRMPEAAFQFRKALALDPDHEEARRYLGYTEGITGDSVIADRFARLE
jgi:tetratricopeptide (TPR) repeat protein